MAAIGGRGRPRFEWDEKKARENERKHDVSFDEAVSVFNDLLSVTISDWRHSEQEHRYVDIGVSDEGRILVVVYVERGSRIRIISVRKATTREKKTYEEAR